MKSNSIWDSLKGQFSRGKITNKIILVNLVVFVLFNLFVLLFQRGIIDYPVYTIFLFSSEFSEFIFQPWSIFLSIVTHTHLDHFFFNMLFLFFSGMMFEELFGERKLILLYILGGVLGNLFELLATSLFPHIAPPHTVVGASGSIMAIFTATAFYRPQTPVYIFGMFPIPLYLLALFFYAKDLIGIGSDDHTAHLGGALIGFLAQLNPHHKNNILNMLSAMFSLKNKKNTAQTKRYKSDDEFNEEKVRNQERIDKILDKISKSGYESLSREEKKFLFKQGNK